MKKSLAKSSNTPLLVIEKFFEDYNFKEREIKITQCEKVLDIKKFIYNHISILKANKGNRVYLPYYNRLEKLYLILKTEL